MKVIGKKRCGGISSRRLGLCIWCRLGPFLVSWVTAVSGRRVLRWI